MMKRLQCPRWDKRKTISVLLEFSVSCLVDVVLVLGREIGGDLDADCIFCKIVSKTVPSHRVFENQDYLAFLDIRPLNPGHVLVVPKKHYRWVWDVPKVGSYFEVVAKIAKVLQNVIRTEWVSSDIAGMGVYHAHIHLIPRLPGDGHGEFPNAANAKDIPEQKMKAIAETIRNGLVQ